MVKISEEQLRDAIMRALMGILSDSQQEVHKTKQKLFAVLGENWDERYREFFRTISGHPHYEAYAVIPTQWNSTGCRENLLIQECCSNIVLRGEVPSDELAPAITVFPTVSRETVVKTALCIGDTFETKWIISCMEQGGRVLFLKSGLERFTGKEPKGYIKKIMEYYRTLLEFDIVIGDSVDDIE